MAVVMCGTRRMRILRYWGLPVEILYIWIRIQNACTIELYCRVVEGVAVERLATESEQEY